MRDRVKARRITGQCSRKQCEGTKPVDWQGNPMSVCLMWEWCVCDCHALITRMYKEVGMDRLPPEQPPAYIARLREQEAKWDMPSVFDPLPATPLSTPGDPNPQTIPREDVGDPVAPRVGGSVAPAPAMPPRMQVTATGRRAKGTLESDVLVICIEFAGDVYEWEYCTPKLIAEEIGKRYAVEPPSTGAINAIWDRWEKLGFATQDKKPSRFVKFNLQGNQEINLVNLKAKVKRDKRTDKMAARHGLRPAQPR